MEGGVFEFRFDNSQQLQNKLSLSRFLSKLRLMNKLSSHMEQLEPLRPYELKMLADNCDEFLKFLGKMPYSFTNESIFTELMRQNVHSLRDTATLHSYSQIKATAVGIAPSPLPPILSPYDWLYPYTQFGADG